MLKKIMLAGLMSVTALAGISPAYAQAGQDRGSRGERAARGDGNVVVSRGTRLAQPRAWTRLTPQHRRARDVPPLTGTVLA